MALFSLLRSCSGTASFLFLAISSRLISSGIITAAQQQLRAYFLEPYKDFRYSSNDSSMQMPLSSLTSQVLLISAYLSSVWLVRRHYRGVLRDSASFLKLAVAHNMVLALVSLALFLMLVDQVRPWPVRVALLLHFVSLPSGVAAPSRRRVAFRDLRREIVGQWYPPSHAVSSSSSPNASDLRVLLILQIRRAPEALLFEPTRQGDARHPSPAPASYRLCQFEPKLTCFEH